MVQHRSNKGVIVDFETLSDIFCSFSDLPEQKCTDMIFMIGVYWKPKQSSNWKYKRFTCIENTYEEEYRIMNEFSEFVNGKNNPRLHYWHAERFFWKSAECRQFDLAADTEIRNNISDNWKNFQWNDLCSLFKSEPIVLKGCFNFGLKSIAKTIEKRPYFNDISSKQAQCAYNHAQRQLGAHYLPLHPKPALDLPLAQ